MHAKTGSHLIIRQGDVSEQSDVSDCTSPEKWSEIVPPSQVTVHGIPLTCLTETGTTAAGCHPHLQCRQRQINAI